MSGADDNVPLSRREKLAVLKGNKKYRKPKPWDTDDIEHWKIEGWKPDYMEAPLRARSLALVCPRVPHALPLRRVIALAWPRSHSFPSLSGRVSP